MNHITLSNVLPHVFAQRTEMSGDIWKKEVRLEKGKLYLVEAASGTGKSTLCSYLLGYRNDYTGRISFDETDARTLKVKDWVNVRQRQISCLFQELRLFPELTALENVQIKNNLTSFKPIGEIEEWFGRLGIADKRDEKIRTLSFGQQQRVAMMRALVQPFDFLLADEPISHLDDTNSDTMAAIMLEEAKKQGAGIIITSIGKHMTLNYDCTFKL